MSSEVLSINEWLSEKYESLSRKVKEHFEDYDNDSPSHLAFLDTVTDQFIKLNAVSKEFIDKDFKSPIINVKMIDLNRQTLPLYKRLDDKNTISKVITN